ncbi:alkylglycerol monooxygenase-like isoform X2 [Panulirus ornatus]
MGAFSIMDLLSLERLGTFFYMVKPSKSTFQNVDDVPDYINEAIPWFMVSVVIEHFYGLMQGKKVGRLSDNLSSVGHGLLYACVRLFTKWFEMSGYVWLYRYRVMDIPWNSPLAWWAGFLAADFVYYWFHRASHEISILWAWHQVHHSHEDYNVTVALRQSMFQRLFGIFFYQPMALLGVPLPAICVHFHLNLLVQFLIHTDVIGKCGPLDWVLNTPSHHRVHHGANKYCLDKNYGGFLILWDKLFGTFAAERDDEDIVYGLVDQPQATNVFYLQFFYIRDILKKARNQDSWGNSLRALLYGPGWSPGSPRLGDIDAFPDVKAPRAKYNPQLPLWQKTYTSVHYLILLFLQQMLTLHLKSYSLLTAFIMVLFILVSISNITAMYDRWMWCGVVEVTRCAVYIAYARASAITGLHTLDVFLLACFFVSMVLWTLRVLLVSPAQAKALKIS